MSDTKILLIYTGGTIGMIKDYETGALKAFNFDELLVKIPELRLLDCEISTASFEKVIDSSNMNPTYWAELCTIIETSYGDYDGFVVLHGSDTMSYSASALSFMLENLAKPVVFTGSQLPIGDLRTDAKENLITAVQVAALKKRNKPVITEVCLYFEYKLYRANRTSKVSAENFEAFASPNYPELLTSGVYLTVNEQDLWKPSRKKFKVHKHLVTEVLLLKLYPGISQCMVEAMLQVSCIKGVVLETFGAGNTTTQEWFLNALKTVIKRGVPIVNVTQCISGSVEMGSYETSVALKRMGMINGGDITTEAAVTKMMYLLGQKIGPKTFKSVYETSLRGELS